jgi:1,4-dihydroxy-2-naphthoate octaprenyltransferase
MLNLESRTGIFVVAYLCLALGFVGLTWAAVEAGNMRSVLFLTCAIICGYIYQVKNCADIRILL